MLKAKINTKSAENLDCELGGSGSADQAVRSIQKQEVDPEHMVALYALVDSAEHFPHEKEDAHWAQLQINLANEKIRELNEEIAKQKANIGKFDHLIQNYKRVKKTKNVNPGRPVRSLDRDLIARELMKKWVASLMCALEAKGCGSERGLGKMLSSVHERNWRRWLNGEAIPQYATFDNLLDEVITYGKYAGEPLFKVPVTPTHNQILTFLQFI